MIPPNCGGRFAVALSASQCGSVPSVGALGEAGKYFGEFLRDPPSKLAVLSRS
jgi:hypothetical protein